MNTTLTVQTPAGHLLSVADDLLTRWERFSDVRAASRRTYANAIKQFLRYLADQGRGLVETSREDVMRWRDELLRDHRPTTVQTYLIAVRMFFRWLADEGVVQKNPADHVKAPKVSAAHKKDYLTSRQCRKLISVTEDKRRDAAMIALMLTTGMRTIEVVRADVGDLRTVGDCSVLFLQGKGRDEKAEYVKLSQKVEEMLRGYLNARDASEEEPLFTSSSNRNQGERMTTRSVSRIAKDALVRAGLKSDRLTAHSLRHTAATLALLGGAKLRDVQEVLRHSKIETTLLYAHEQDRMQNDTEQRIADMIFRG